MVACRWFGLVAVLAVAMGGPAEAQTYPARPITLVVGIAAGSTQDVVARLVGRHAGHILGQQIVIENKPGAGTMTASSTVAKAAPDGYTLLQNGVALSVNSSLYKQVPYDAADFVPVAFLVTAPQMLVVNPALGVTSLRELIDKYKHSETLNYGSPGAGTMPHLTAELFRVRSGLPMRHVPYRGGGPALSDTIAGHIQLTVVSTANSSYVESGKVRALAVGARQRVESLPDVPTFAEAGLPMPEIEFGSWLGIVAPKGTPAGIVKKLNAAFNAVLHRPEVLAELKALGLIPHPMSAEEFADFLRDDMKKWPEIIAAAGLKAE